MDQIQFEDLSFTRLDGVATIKFERPERLNAFTFPMIADINRCIGICAQDKAVRSLVVRGAGRAFSAGDNIKDMGPTDYVDDPLLRMREAGYVSTVRALRALDKPVITVTQGYAMGAGLEVFMGGDIRLTLADAQLGIPFIKLGLAGGTYQLPRLVGITRAAAMLFSGDPISGRDAVTYGLATEALEDTLTLESRLNWWTDTLGQRATRSIGLMKRALYSCYERTYDSATELATLNFVTATHNGDREKGVAAWRAQHAAKPGLDTGKTD